MNMTMANGAKPMNMAVIDAVITLKVAEMNATGSGKEVCRRAKLHIFRQIELGSKEWKFCITEKICS